MPTQVIMPQLGESVVEGTVTKWLKQEGEPIEEMESLLEVNTDKVDTEIPSPAGGTLLKIVVPEGETVKAGTIIAWIGQPGEAPPAGGVPGAEGSAPAKEAAEPVELPTQPVSVERASNGGEAPVPAGRSRELGFISPIVARLAQEHRVDLAQVKGSGESGRITKKDVLAYIEQAGEKTEEAEAIPAPWETPGEGDLFRPTEMVFNQGRPQDKTRPIHPPAEAEPGKPPSTAQPVVTLPGEGEVLPLSSMRRKIAEHMVMSKRTAPHVTTVMEADLQRMLAHYQANKGALAREGVRLTYTAYFVAAAVRALRAFPIVNSSWTEEGVRLLRAVNIGLAVSLGEEGLIVPVLKNADALSLVGLARAINTLADQARGHQLKPEDVQGGTFTITNHGISGSLFATPVINQPQCAILGVGAVQKRVMVVEDPAGGDSIAIRPMAYLSLTFDHRILDGAAADGFLGKVVETLEGWS